MTEKYPIPDYAVSLWVAGDDLWIAFPGQGPEGRGHSIRLPASQAGLATTVAVLRERAQAQSLRLGSPGTPTQWELERQHADFLAGLKIRREQQAAKETARREALEHERATALEREHARRRAVAELEELGL